MQRRQFTRLSLFLFGLGLADCSKNQVESTKGFTINRSNSLRIWWSQGYYPEETDALKEIIARWTQKSGIKVELSLLSEKDTLKELNNAIAAGNPPDIFYSIEADTQIIPRLAWNNQLADVSEVVEPLEKLYTGSVLQSVTYLNNVAKKRSYYAVPIMQYSVYIHCWQDLLAAIGKTPDAIPKDWQGFWQFWHFAQQQLRHQGQQTIYGIGLPMSEASDTFDIFENFLEAYNVKLINSNGRLRLDNPQVHQGITAALAKYTNFYKNGTVPPEAVDWGNTDNNIAFLSRTTLMTANPSLSIPGSQRQDQAIYTKQLATVPWPNKPKVEPMKPIASIGQVILLERSDKKQVAKDFLFYLVQPQNLKTYIQGSQGRFVSVLPKALPDRFWNDGTDPHISVALKQLQQTTRLPYQVFTPIYAEVQSQNVWGKAIRTIVVDGLSVAQATHQAIAQIKQIFADWK
ncbi:ABC transporter substrate-binding protein [Moorena sp. SIO3I6]|uniref:ABC transporter substrate-binding protein n=1 Tax=Moorena sp. SIO3I6 TaxID=2607831 RepID=UPI0013F823B7|nr:ABC transporter substrate-binding protein [Moorena sp. SIO3I6]NEP26849.1 carbohydrate ABC transporter substrate-binding protein [Moorena sp. SIO3I6]